MCYNCGCGIPNDDHGRGHAGVDKDGKAITDKTFEAASQAFEMKDEESKKECPRTFNEADAGAGVITKAKPSWKV